MPLAKHEFICTYEGDVISKTESAACEVLYKAQGIGCYQVDIKKTGSVVYASLTEGFGRYMNHAKTGATAKAYHELLKVVMQHKNI